MARKIILIILGCIVGIVLVGIIGINVYMHVAYSKFYNISEFPWDMPGMNDGFVIQDSAYMDSADLWLYSGYMDNHTPSPVWRYHHDGSYDKFYIQLPDGSNYTGHAGGITSYNKWVYVVSEDEGCVILNAEDVAHAKDGATITAVHQMTLDCAPAFINVIGNTLYTGEFYREGTQYLTPDTHHIVGSDGTENPALMYQYELSESCEYGFEPENPTAVYSIGADTQGCTLTPSGNFVFSTSWGLEASHLYIYDGSNFAPMGTYFIGGKNVPLYMFSSDRLIEDLKVPPMSEGINTKDGKIWMVDEAASNKYFFGKLYGFFKVAALTID